MITFLQMVQIGSYFGSLFFSKALKAYIACDCGVVTAGLLTLYSEVGRESIIVITDPYSL